MANENKFLDNSGLTYFREKIQTLLDGKVDKASGKGLSTNDFTNEDKNHLHNLKNSYITYLDLLGPKNLITVNSGTANDDLIIPLDTTIKAGNYMMYVTVLSSGTTSSNAYITLLKDGVSVDRTIRLIVPATGGGSFTVPSSGANQIEISSDTGTSLTFKNFQLVPSNTFDLAENYTDYVPSNKTLYNLLSAKADASTTYTKYEVNDALFEKVDKESGKGLSANDFTNDYKNTLDSKVVLKSGSKYLSGEFEPEYNYGANLGSTNYRFNNLYIKYINGTQPGSVLGKNYISSATSGSDDLITSGGVYNALSDKVDKVSGKGLSTNDFTTPLKNKLDGIASGAEVNVQSDWNVTSSSSDAYIKNKPSLGTAASKNTTTNISSSTTTIPTSSVVYDVNTAQRANAARLLNKSSKNLLDFANLSKVSGAATVNKNDDSITASSVVSGGSWINVAYTLPILPSGTYTFTAHIDSLSVSGGNARIMVAKTTGGQSEVGGVTLNGANTTVRFNFTSSGEQLYLFYYPNYSSVGRNNSFTASKNMLCTSEDYDLSSDFVSYAPTNRELYEMINRFKVVNKTINLKNKVFNKSSSGSYYLPESSATTVSELTTICSIIIYGTAYLRNEYVLTPRTIGSANKVGFMMSYITSGTLPDTITITDNLMIDLRIFGIV